MRIEHSALLVALGVMAGCQTTGSTGLTAADRAALEQVTASFAVAMNDADWGTLARMYTEDAWLLPPDEPMVRGRSAIQSHFASFPPFTDLVLDLHEIDGHGDLAYVVGTYTMTIDPDGLAIANTGKFIEVRRRTPQGWLLSRDIYNSDVPTP